MKQESLRPFAAKLVGFGAFEVIFPFEQVRFGLLRHTFECWKKRTFRIFKTRSSEGGQRFLAVEVDYEDNVDRLFCLVVHIFSNYTVFNNGLSAELI